MHPKTRQLINERYAQALEDHYARTDHHNISRNMTLAQRMHLTCNLLGETMAQALRTGVITNLAECRAVAEKHFGRQWQFAVSEKLPPPTETYSALLDPSYRRKFQQENWELEHLFNEHDYYIPKLNSVKEFVQDTLFHKFGVYRVWREIADVYDERFATIEDRIMDSDLDLFRPDAIRNFAIGCSDWGEKYPNYPSDHRYNQQPLGFEDNFKPPEQPVKPEEPPVKPEEPELPVNPEEPEIPVKPEEPELPVKPEEPEQPQTPAEPEQPQTPSKPEQPQTPTELEKPAKPQTPVEPASQTPTEPERPQTPVEPASQTPSEPEKPQTPAEPEQPTRPPTEPAKPQTPVEPEIPVKPEEPSEPEKPQTPVEPEQPARPPTEPAKPQTPVEPEKPQTSPTNREIEYPEPPFLKEFDDVEGEVVYVRRIIPRRNIFDK